VLVTFPVIYYLLQVPSCTILYYLLRTTIATYNVFRPSTSQHRQYSASSTNAPSTSRHSTHHGLLERSMQSEVATTVIGKLSCT